MSFSSNDVFLKRPRSVFSRPKNVKIPMVEGQIVPLVVQMDVMPNDTFSYDLSWFLRSATPAFPVMDQAVFSVYAFFVPHRLVWDHFQNFWGQNDTGAWTLSQSYEYPKIEASFTNPDTNVPNLAQYLYGMSCNNNGASLGNVMVNAIPARAYLKIYNDYFRWEVTDAPVLFSKGDSAVDSVTFSALASTPLTACKFSDLFSTCLPAPQRGAPVSILGGTAPVVTNNSNFLDVGASTPGLVWKYKSNSLVDPNSILGISSAGGGKTVVNDSLGVDMDNSIAVPVNLVADLNAANNTVNMLRLAVATQRYLEQLNRTGNAYWEVISGVFGLRNPSQAVLQRAQYLGGFSQPLNMSQVVATANSAEGTAKAVGDTGAVSISSGRNSLITYSATEHGTFMIVGVIRTNNTYFQGLEKQFTRFTREEQYVPQLALIGEQPVMRNEIFWSGNDDTHVFGYQEAWYDYRHSKDVCLGVFADKTNGNLFSYRKVLTSAPILNSAFIHEDKSKIDQTLLVSSTESGFQYLCDFHFSSKWARCMPTYSQPGLMDHF